MAKKRLIFILALLIIILLANVARGQSTSPPGAGLEQDGTVQFRTAVQEADPAVDGEKNRMEPWPEAAGVRWSKRSPGQFRNLDAPPLAEMEQISPTVVEPESQIQIMMDQVVSSTVVHYDGALSGEWPAIIGGQPYTIETRYTYSGQPISKATQFVGERLDSLGLSVEYHQWGEATYPNVVGEISGQAFPDTVYIFSAHLDDRSGNPLTNAPGADDNASGSTATLLAAEILSQFQWDCTVRFAFWTGEEQGLLGSGAYAQRAYNRGENIAGVLNLDMIAWNSPGSDPGIDLHASTSVPESLEMTQLFAGVVDAYELDLIPEIVPNGTNRSDHASFWTYDYPAMLAIEDLSDFNPFYHTIGDSLSQLDIAYFTEFVRASIGVLGHMAECRETSYLPLMRNSE